MSTCKLKVGDIVYCYVAAEKGRTNPGPPKIEKYEIIKVGRQYYTVRLSGCPHSCCDRQIVIETFKDTVNDYSRPRIWFKSMEEYQQWSHRGNVIRNIKETQKKMDLTYYKDWTIEDLEKLLILLQKYC